MDPHRYAARAFAYSSNEARVNTGKRFKILKKMLSGGPKGMAGAGNNESPNGHPCSAPVCGRFANEVNPINYLPPREVFVGRKKKSPPGRWGRRNERGRGPQKRANCGL